MASRCRVGRDPGDLILGLADPDPSRQSSKMLAVYAVPFPRMSCPRRCGMSLQRTDRLEITAPCRITRPPGCVTRDYAPCCLSPFACVLWEERCGQAHLSRVIVAGRMSPGAPAWGCLGSLRVPGDGGSSQGTAGEAGREWEWCSPPCPRVAWRPGSGNRLAPDAVVVMIQPLRIGWQHREAPLRRDGAPLVPGRAGRDAGPCVGVGRVAART